MKNNGFLKETTKGSGIFKATEKLNNLMYQKEGMLTGNGCSSRHSAAILKNVQALPKEILEEGRFLTGANLKKEMEQYKTTKEYALALERLQHQNADTIAKREQYHDEAQSLGNQAQRLQESFNYKADMDSFQRSKDILHSDTPLYVPDFATVLRQEEAQEVLTSMQERMEMVTDNSREYDFLNGNCEKLERILTTMDSNVMVYFEIVTDSYGRPELERHQNYEQIMNRDVLYVC